MSRAKKIILSILIVLGILLIAGVGALLWSQWDNVSAVIDGLRHSQEELETKIADNDQAVKDAVAAMPEVTVRDITEEERQALRDGTLTSDELVQNLITPQQQPEKDPETGEGYNNQQPKPPADPGQKPDSKPEQQGSSSPPTVPEKTPEQLAYEQELSAIIARVYVLREDFLGRLDALMNQAIAEFGKIPAEERTASKLAAFASGYLSIGFDMEAECDAQIEAIVVELETLLKENNGDLSIAQTVYDTYVEEKSLKKAWYMAELKKRGFV